MSIDDHFPSEPRVKAEFGAAATLIYSGLRWTITVPIDGTDHRFTGRDFYEAVTLARASMEAAG